MSMPEQKPGRSKQDYATPSEFIWAVVSRFGQLTFDLAANDQNTVCPSYFDEDMDSLIQDWHKLSGNLWLNPPFGDIDNWAEKCAKESAGGAKIFMLVPASVGSNWYMNFVEPYAYVLGLNPRLSFDGVAPYPKDCVLACYIYGLTGFKTWRWK
jgi:phage N-6-adenine-methyltransferase